VHLLPLTKMGKSQSPYSAADLFLIDPLYAECQSEFNEFVETALKLELRLCFDLVLNHISPDSSIVKIHPDWIQPDTTESDGLKRAGCWHENKWIRWDDLVLINYDHPDPLTRRAIWDAMRNYALFWSDYAAKTKGMVRLDNLHSSNEAFVTYLRHELKQAYPELIIFAEFFADDVTLLKKSYAWDLNLLLGQPWHHSFVPQLRGFFAKHHEHGYQLHHVMQITTHDTPTIKQMYYDACYTIPRYAACAFFSCGKVGVTMGNELGMEDKLRFIGEPYSLNLFEPHPFKIQIKKINHILENEPTLRGIDNLTFIDFNHPALMIAIRKGRAQEQKDLLLVVSMDQHNVQYFKLNLKENYRNANSVAFIEKYNEAGIKIKDGQVIQIQP